MNTILPNNPIMLLSVVNTQLRDNYSSLAEFCDTYMVDEDELILKLESVDYIYNVERNQFI